MPYWDVRFDIRLQTEHHDVIACVAKAHALSSVIRDIPIPPSAKYRIDALNILRAVRGTTGIEGAELTEDEVRQIMEATPGTQVLPKNRSREEQEARNAEALMYYVVDCLIRNPKASLTEELVCEIHEITTRDIDYPNNDPGKYRTYPVHAGSYIPPRTGDEVRRLMSGFIDWFNQADPTRWDPVIRAILAHFYIVSIHPFGDGNGRTSRGVESFLLYQAGINARGFYSLANYYYRHREEYIRILDQVRFETNEDLTPFILFALRGLVEELEAVHREVLAEVQQIGFRDYAREQLAYSGKLATKAGERMLRLVLGLGRDPVSIKALRSGEHTLSRLYRNVTPKTLSRDLSFLREHELIVVEGDILRANLDVMIRYTPPFEVHMQRPIAQHQKSPKKGPAGGDK